MRSLALALALLVPPAGLLPAQTGASDQRLVAALREFVPRVLRLNGTPGLNLAVARRGEIIWEEGFGFADLERKVPMTKETVTHSGSMGKTYTATAVMQLVERGALELDAPVNRYLRGFRIENPLGGREVTVRDLLTHRSGLAQNGAYSVLSSPKPLTEHVPAAYAARRNDYYDGSAAFWKSKPGEKYEYSNLGIATLGYLVEVTNPDKLSFSGWVQKHIMDPLGMRSSQYPPVQDSVHVRPEIWARMSKGYAGVGPLRVPTPAIYFEDHPAGTVVTTPGDHIKLLLAYLGRGTYGGYRLLRPETVDTMLTPQVELATDVAVGLVWNLREWAKPTKSFGHSGAHMWGWTNTFIAFPELDLALAVSMNQWSLPDDAGARYREASLIIDFARGWVERERARRPAAEANRSWAWKVSYVAGLMMVERINGVLGIEETLGPDDVELMATGTRVQAQLERGEPVWDPDGFRAGIRDMAQVEMRPESIAKFIRSGRIRVASEELPLIYLELGGRGTLPAPR